jgi:hypothetical protein
MAPLSLNRHALVHALVGWGMLLAPPMAGAFVVPMSAGTQNSPFRSSSSVYMVPSQDGFRSPSYPRVGSATQEQVTAAEAALRAEIEAVMRRSDPFAAFAATIDIGKATPEQVAEAQAALDVELAAARADQSQSQPKPKQNNNIESRFPFKSTQSFANNGQSTTGQETSDESFYGTSETQAAETKALAALHAVVGASAKTENNQPFAPPPPSARPFSPGMSTFSNNNNTPALNMARAGATPALQNAAKTAATPIFDKIASGVPPAKSNSQQSMTGTPAMNIAQRMAQAGPARETTNNNINNQNIANGMASSAQNERPAQSTANGSPTEVKIDASSGNIPWFGQRAAASTIKQPPSSTKEPWFTSTSPPATSSSPSIQTVHSMNTSTGSSRANEDYTSALSTAQSTGFDAPKELHTSSKATVTADERISSQRETSKLESTSGGFSFSFPSFPGFSAKPSSSSSSDAFNNDRFNGGSPYDAPTIVQYSSEPNQSYSDTENVYARYDPAPPKVDPPRNTYWDQSYSYKESVEDAIDDPHTYETPKPKGPLENFWMNTLSQQQRLQLNRAAVKVVEYSLPVTAATAYMLSNNAEPLRNAEAAVEYLSYSAIPTAYQEWISEDKTTGLTTEANSMSQYMDRMNAPWAMDANGRLVIQVPTNQESAGAMRAEIVAATPDVMPSQPDATEQEPQAQWNAEGAPSSYAEYMQWRAQQEAQTQDQFSPAPEHLSNVNPDAAVAAGVGPMLNEPSVSEPSPTYADQMWTRAMTVPQAPERTFDQDMPPSHQAPSQADNWWQQAMTVPPAPVQTARQDLTTQPQEPSFTDRMWERLATKPTATDSIPQQPEFASSGGAIPQQAEQYEDYNSDTTRGMLASSQERTDPVTSYQQQQQAMSNDGKDAFPLNGQDEASTSVWAAPFSDAVANAPRMNQQSPSFYDGPSAEVPGQAKQQPSAVLYQDATLGAPAPIDAQQQQIARDMQAMTAEANANASPEFPPAFVPELEYNGAAAEPVFEEEISPVIWSSHDYYYGYREDASLF